MKTSTRLLTAAILALAGLAFIGLAGAQQLPPQQQPPPQQQGQQADVDNQQQPGVARLSFIRGDVSMQRGDSGDTSAVDLNTPLEPGDQVFTGSRSRAEIQLDWADILRLDESSQASIATLDNNRIQVQLSQGLFTFSVLSGSEAAVEIDTPNVSVTPRVPGLYRVEVNAEGDTQVTVRDGDADVSTPDGSTQLHRNDLITVRGTGSDVRFQITPAPGTDDFDRWSADRDRIISNADSYSRTNRYYTGAADLDSYGRWDNIDDYGWVWVPRVAIGWAPYRQGRWVWQSYWGWTWTSYEPWGWAPYHYGRWFVHGSSWVWWPGPVTRTYRPVYAPAYVSFFGFGSRAGFSTSLSFGGFGSIGWLPAGPGDFVNPWWGRYRGEFNVVSVNNINGARRGAFIAPLRGGDRDSNVHNMLVNSQIRYGMSAVAADNFGHGRAMTRTVGVEELRGGQFMTGNVPVVPTRESLRTSDRTVVAGAARPQSQTRFFSRQAPSAQRESFTAESARMRQSIEPFNNGSGNNGAANRTAGNPGGIAARSGNAPEPGFQRQAPQSTPQARAQTPAANAGGPGGRNSFSGNPQNNPRTPPQGSASAPPSSASALPQINSQIRTNRNPEAQQSAAPAPGPTQADGYGGWQRFSGPRGNTYVGQGVGQGNGSQPDARPAPPTNGRPQLELSRPIIQPRSFRDPTPNAQRQPAPNNYQRYAPPPPQSAPQAAAPRYEGRPAPAPQGNFRPEGGGGGGAPRGGFSGGGSSSGAGGGRSSGSSSGSSGSRSSSRSSGSHSR